MNDQGPSAQEESLAQIIYEQAISTQEESLAQIIYEQAIIPAARHCHTEAPEWVAGGNSIAQDDARVAARAIIRRWPREEQAVAESIQRQLLRRIDTLEQELERERLRLTACGVAAKADTPESAAKARNCHPDYCSASLDDVCEMVDKLMVARAQLKLEARDFRAMVDQVVPHEEVPHEDWPSLELERLRQRQRTRAELLAIVKEPTTPTNAMDDYITLLISVVFLEPCVEVKRFSVGISLNDPLIANLELAEWREPENKRRLLSLLADDWLTGNCEIIGCEQINGGIQWHPRERNR